MKHITLWSRENGVEPRAQLNAAQKARAISPVDDALGLIANWPGTGADLAEATAETVGYEIAHTFINVRDGECVPRRFSCDNGLGGGVPCAPTSQLAPIDDADSDGLIDLAEVACHLPIDQPSASFDRDFDGVYDHAACLEQGSTRPMLSLRIDASDPYTVELWLDQPIDALAPVLLELFIDFDEDVLTYTESTSGDAALIVNANLFIALVEPEQDMLRLTIVGPSNDQLHNGRLGTITFVPDTLSTPISSVIFKTDQYQVAPLYIMDHLTFGEGHPSAPLSLP
jgi:hypothetical protein